MTKRIKLTLEYLEKRLEYFENRYQMDSSDFYAKYNKGEFPDTHEMVEWASYYDMAAKAGLKRKTLT